MLQSYQLSKTPHFILSVKETPDGIKHEEIILEKPLDREQQSSHHLILAAVDRGDPFRTGTVTINFKISDASDNPPIFTEETYKVSLRENLPKGSFLLQVKAMDKDEGLNAKIAYTFSDIQDTGRQLFKVDPEKGDTTSKDPWSISQSQPQTKALPPLHPENHPVADFGYQ